MKCLFNYRVMAILVFSVVSAATCAAASPVNQEQVSSIKSLEDITSQVDSAPALLYLTPAQIDAASVEPVKITSKKKRNNLDSHSTADERGRLHELKVQQATINQLKERVEQQKSELQALRDNEKAMINPDNVEDNLKNALDDSQNSIKELQQKITALTLLSDQKTQEIDVLKKIKNGKKTGFTLPENAIAYRDYAIGASLGASIISLLATREKQGVIVDKKLVIAGAEDAVFDQLKLSPEKIDKALRDTEAAIAAHEKQAGSQTELQGARYIKQFMKQPKSKKAAQGFYYRIDSPGEGKINGSDTVTIVMKESLADGKVVKDMNASGMAMSQRLDAYPPLFKAALMLMRNHGAMELVVPPELAYGEKGLPPLIPPNSTVIYTIRILDVLP